MKVKGYEIEGTAEYWMAEVCIYLRAQVLESFLIAKIVCASPALSHIEQWKARWEVAKCIVGRALQRGRKMGIFEYTDKIWQVRGKDES